MRRLNVVFVEIFLKFFSKGFHGLVSYIKKKRFASEKKLAFLFHLKYNGFNIDKEDAMTTKAELLKMVRRNCISCMGDQPFLVEGCTCPDCEFFEFRDGKDPRPTRKGNMAGLRAMQNASARKQKNDSESTNDVDRRAE